MIQHWRQRVIWVAVLSLASFWIWQWLANVDYPVQPTESVVSAQRKPAFNRADLEVQEGASGAQAQGIARHEECRVAFGQGLRALGCHNHVTAGKTIPPLVVWNTHATTQACIASVRAHYAPLMQDMVERGDHHAAGVVSRRHLNPELNQCQIIDNSRIFRDVHEPLDRLNAMLAHVREGLPLSSDEIRLLQRELPVVEGFRIDPMRSKYLELADELFAALGGRELVFPLAVADTPIAVRCADLARQVERKKAVLHHSLSTLAQDGGRHSKGPEQAKGIALQEQALTAMRQATDDQLRTGCPRVP